MSNVDPEYQLMLSRRFELMRRESESTFWGKVRVMMDRYDVPEREMRQICVDELGKERGALFDHYITRSATQPPAVRDLP